MLCKMLLFSLWEKDFSTNSTMWGEREREDSLKGCLSDFLIWSWLPVWICLPVLNISACALLCVFLGPNTLGPRHWEWHTTLCSMDKLTDILPNANMFWSQRIKARRTPNKSSKYHTQPCCKAWQAPWLCWSGEVHHSYSSSHHCSAWAPAQCCLSWPANYAIAHACTICWFPHLCSPSSTPLFNHSPLCAM